MQRTLTSVETDARGGCFVVLRSLQRGPSHRNLLLFPSLNAHHVLFNTGPTRSSSTVRSVTTLNQKAHLDNTMKRGGRKVGGPVRATRVPPSVVWGLAILEGKSRNRPAPGSWSYNLHLLPRSQ